MALSMNIEMRVLPSRGSNAPRLPLEKSYSALILFTFLAGCTARRNWADIVAAMGINDSQHLTGTAHADRNKALLARCVRIFYVTGKGIFEYPFRVGERYLVLLEVCRRLVRVVLKAHFR